MTDNQLDEATRVVGEREVDGKTAKTITLARTYPTDLDDLWEAVTDPERIARWFGSVSGDLRLGGRFHIENNASGTITACEPPKSFDATWEFAGAVSWIEVRLTAIDESNARVALTHLAYPDEHWEQFGPAAGGLGWDLALAGLSFYLHAPGTSGDSGFDLSEGEAWMASADGLRFLADAARAWAEADIAGGEDPEVAQAAADRSLAAYTQPPES